MSQYLVEVLVTYTVEAESPEHARAVIEEGTEFPLMPYHDNNYATKDEIVSIREAD